MSVDAETVFCTAQAENKNQWAWISLDCVSSLLHTQPWSVWIIYRVADSSYKDPEIYGILTGNVEYKICSGARSVFYSKVVKYTNSVLK